MPVPFLKWLNSWITANLFEVRNKRFCMFDVVFCIFLAFASKAKSSRHDQIVDDINGRRKLMGWITRAWQVGLDIRPRADEIGQAYLDSGYGSEEGRVLT